MKQPGRQPPISLKGVVPSLYITCVQCDQGVEGFDTFGGAERPLELWHRSQPIQGEGFLEPFLKAVQCRCIHQRQAAFEVLQRGFRVQ